MGGDPDRAGPVHADPGLVRAPRRETADPTPTGAHVLGEGVAQLGKQREALERLPDVEALDLHPHTRLAERPLHRAEGATLDLVPERPPEAVVQDGVHVGEPFARRRAERGRQVETGRERPGHPNPGRCSRNST
jgi:hypothetical protein